jgi:hydrogenase 3 maturation protease
MNPTWKTLLHLRIRDKARIAVLGIGSDLRADDGAGMHAAQRILSKSPAFPVFLGHTAPENLTGEIIRYRPDCVIMIDALDCGQDPGFIRLADRDLEETGSPFPSHKMPFNVLINYLETSIGCDCVVVGIQPGCLEFGRALTPAVKKAANGVAAAIAEWRNQP